MKHIGVPLLLALSIALLGGWLAVDLRADSESPGNSQTYQADRFTIQLPKDLTATAYTLENDQHLVTFENTDGTKGFQVFTLPYNGPLAVDALKREIPDLVISDLELSTVGGEPALAFDSHDPDIGDTSEVWFVHDGLLYQVMTYRPLGTWMRDVLQTWAFR